MGMNMKKNQGLTLVELMVTLAVFAILAVVGLPQISEITNNNRMVAEINSITGALALARSESIKRGRTITICASTDEATCNTNEWEDGWIMFVDPNRNAVVEISDTMLKIGDEITAGNTLRLAKSDTDGVLQYKSDGTMRDRNNDGFDDGTFVLCDRARASDGTTDHEERARAININRLGRVSRAEDTDGTADEIVNDIDGANVACPP